MMVLKMMWRKQYDYCSSTVAKLVVMLVMLNMTKHFLKMYVFLFAFIYFILSYVLIRIFFIFRIVSCMIFSDIFGYSDFRVFPMASSQARICCLWQSCKPCSACPRRESFSLGSSSHAFFE